MNGGEGKWSKKGGGLFPLTCKVLPSPPKDEWERRWSVRYVGVCVTMSMNRECTNISRIYLLSIQLGSPVIVVLS